MADIQDAAQEAQAEFGDHIIIGPDCLRDKQAEWDALEAEIEKLPEDHWLRDPEMLEAYRQHTLRALNPEEQALFDEYMHQHEENNKLIQAAGGEALGQHARITIDTTAVPAPAADTPVVEQTAEVVAP